MLAKAVFGMAVVGLVVTGIHLTPIAAQTIVVDTPHRARGSGRITHVACVFNDQTGFLECAVSNGGATLSFDLTQPVGDMARGGLRLSDSDLGVVVESNAMVGFIAPSFNVVQANGPCFVTDGLGTTVGTCSFSATDRGEPGSQDAFFLSWQTAGRFGDGCCQLLSGGTQIE